MSRCSELEALLPALVDGELAAERVAAVEEHLAGCEPCAELVTALRTIADAAAAWQQIEPPPQLAADLASSPCRRWLGLLFAAIDHQLGDANLRRLLAHMESCEACRRAWNDLALIHQVGEAMTPPPGLAERCASLKVPSPRRAILSRRSATAAAYVLAVLTSIMAGNPVTLARNPAAEAVRRVASSVSDQVTTVADDGRGEIRVMLWRALKWGERQAAAAHQLIDSLSNDNDSRAEQGGTQ